MKKVNNLEVNLKKCLAVLATTVTIGAMGGCAKEVSKEEITDTPSVTTPVTQEPIEEEIVEVDPNAPLFDIQDEEVFNQKLDELNSKIEGLDSVHFYTKEVVLTIDDIKYAKLFLSFLNAEELTSNQLQYINEYTPTMEHKYFDINNIIIVALQNNVNMEEFVANKDTKEFAKKICDIYQEEKTNGVLSQESLDFINECNEKYISADTLELNECIKANLFRICLFDMCSENEEYVEFYQKLLERFITPGEDLLYKMTDEAINQQIQNTKSNTLVKE